MAQAFAQPSWAPTLSNPNTSNLRRVTCQFFGLVLCGKLPFKNDHWIVTW